MRDGSVKIGNHPFLFQNIVVLSNLKDKIFITLFSPLAWGDICSDSLITQK